ncbi:50S ribosomal protein L25 [Buchnera aphidicola (Nipponaphis monzeni)]|uniref:Large ribosomal subunit protein bL25 n=1 Tax=Buchnera aphidicola (Nipponaphis monzeni) TaxID=2495405 RepID=A0A455T9Z0_9GAMM|nr:50S ribosomal protein L25 [Buchnera aphidicola]BBI01125.1 50S ribosomal protein L25 [Buchnera aphidicola (Nipponaphis monzeni)]
MLTLHAEIRKKTGKSSSRRLRKIYNKFPGIIYGTEKPSLHITIDHNEVINLQLNSTIYKKDLNIKLNNKKYLVKIKSIQRHPYKLKILHIDFLYSKN